MIRRLISLFLTEVNSLEELRNVVIAAANLEEVKPIFHSEGEE